MKVYTRVSQSYAALARDADLELAKIVLEVE